MRQINIHIKLSKGTPSMVSTVHENETLLTSRPICRASQQITLPFGPQYSGLYCHCWWVAFIRCEMGINLTKIVKLLGLDFYFVFKSTIFFSPVWTIYANEYPSNKKQKYKRLLCWVAKAHKQRWIWLICLKLNWLNMINPICFMSSNIFDYK